MNETKLTSNGVALQMALLYEKEAVALLYKQGSTSNGIAPLLMALLYKKTQKQWRCFTNKE